MYKASKRWNTIGIAEKVQHITLRKSYWFVTNVILNHQRAPSHNTTIDTTYCHHAFMSVEYSTKILYNAHVLETGIKLHQEILIANLVCNHDQSCSYTHVTHHRTMLDVQQ